MSLLGYLGRLLLLFFFQFYSLSYPSSLILPRQKRDFNSRLFFLTLTIHSEKFATYRKVEKVAQ